MKIESNPDAIPREPESSEAIQAWLIQQLAEQLQIEPNRVDVRAPFDSYGLDSSQVFIIASKAEKAFGFELSPVLVWHYPTVESLSRRLVEEFTVAEQVFEI
ncbi:phosphopantetheine-binding protein [Altericista sp. CCNU0014]|uniref:phosphopantetheine-binding protein n=1 Tax=Altericista sp. CCNU0014 TaxID=3082949 RepID=UPI00384B92FF